MKSIAILHVIRQMSKSGKSSLLSVKTPGPVFTDKNGNIVLHVLAKPGAKSNGITGIEEEGVGVQINARPIDGEANSELVNYMMSVLGLKKKELSLEKGMKSRQKVLVILKKDLTPEKIIEILKQEIELRK